ncbi:MAG: zinc ribbon domain-containing protein, partial [Alphaproteobacteria bacterium]|nr:zinc ribbon domain-containing protein [Alphaproteobacteria bacterium]
MPKKCHKCYTENLDSALFCKECGTPFEIVCPQCKKVCDNGMRLCNECGAPLHPKKSINRSLYKVCRSIVVLVLIVVLFPTMRSCLSRTGLTKKTVDCPMDQYNQTEIKYGDSIADYDGNTYKTVIIGNRVW